MLSRTFFFFLAVLNFSHGFALILFWSCVVVDLKQGNLSLEPKGFCSTVICNLFMVELHAVISTNLDINLSIYHKKVSWKCHYITIFCLLSWWCFLHLKNFSYFYMRFSSTSKGVAAIHKDSHLHRVDWKKTNSLQFPFKIFVFQPPGSIVLKSSFSLNSR